MNTLTCYTSGMYDTDIVYEHFNDHKWYWLSCLGPLVFLVLQILNVLTFPVFRTLGFLGPTNLNVLTFPVFRTFGYLGPTDFKCFGLSSVKDLWFSWSHKF
jgi:hypothetical protein